MSPNCVACFRCIENCPKKALCLGMRDYVAGLKEIKDNLAGKE
jgi:formate hydrogenlyase subunit 6/NADH:ubiquinone oxidoreductase subunit I